MDCGDSNCCSHPACKENIMCVYFADPVDVLLRKPPPPPSAGFFSKVRFLIEGDKSVQSYSKPESYDERRAAVIRYCSSLIGQYSEYSSLIGQYS